eukprot:gene2370-2731_t
MAYAGAGGEEFFFGDDLDAVLALLGEDLPAESDPFDADLNVLMEEIDSTPPAGGFSCEKCGKICKTKRGLTRHTNTKHIDVRPDVESSAGSKRRTPEQMLHPLSFKKFIEISAAKLASDECYSDKLRAEFSDYKISFDDVAFSYQYVRDVIGSFKGNAEKFYPDFYRCVSSEEIVLKNLSRRGSIILGFEMANHVLAHLTGAIVKEGDVAFSHPISFSSKEVNIIQYLSGYVFGTVYRRIRRSNATRSMLGVQSLSILLARKSALEMESSLSEKNIFTNAKNRGGLWTVTSEVFEIFSLVETKFRQFTNKMSKIIDSKQMVSDLLENPIVLANYKRLCNQASDKVSKEVALNLLEHMIMLYVRVRTFSYVKDQVEVHNIQSKKKKARSRRTEIKKATGSLDQGH